MPLENIHKHAFKAAEAAHCAGEQGKYWEMHDRLFENYKTLDPWTPHAEAVGLDVAPFEECLSSGRFANDIRRDMSEGRKAGVTGTPAFMLGRTDPDSNKVRILAVLKGAKSFNTFKAEIDRLLEQAPEADKLEPARSAAPVTSGTIDADTVNTLQRVLLTAPIASPVWITAPRSDPRALARAEDLARVFKSAGWRVEPVSQTVANVRPGTYLFAGDSQPPGYVGAVRLALEEAGFAPSYAIGYRDYYEQKVATEPGFRGFPFKAGQTFVLVVGRTP